MPKRNHCFEIVFYPEVLDVERSLLDAELKLSEITQNQLSSMIQLYTALGERWKTILA